MKSSFSPTIRNEGFLLLNEYVLTMESEGLPGHLVRINVDRNLGDKIYDNSGREFSQDELEKIADVCFAEECLASTCMGPKYDNLQITPKGQGIVKSIRAEQSRTRSKTLSDWLSDHAGLTSAGSVIIAMFALVVSILALFND